MVYMFTVAFYVNVKRTNTTICDLKTLKETCEGLYRELTFLLKHGTFYFYKDET